MTISPAPTLDEQRLSILWDDFIRRREELRRSRRFHRPSDNPAEFHQLARLLRQSGEGCGWNHAEGVAADYQSKFGYAAIDLLDAARNTGDAFLGPI